jgi:hypothetical protein
MQLDHGREQNEYEPQYLYWMQPPASGGIASHPVEAAIQRASKKSDALNELFIPRIAAQWFVTWIQVQVNQSG